MTKTNNQTCPQSLGARDMKGVNWVGLQTLIKKEVSRFASVYVQTVVAPVIMTLLFYAVFALAFGGNTRTIGDLPYLTFLAPGLVMMTMVQNAFANTSSSLMIGKISDTISDILMPPLSAFEIFWGYIIGGICRGVSVGVSAILVVAVVVGVEIHSFWHILGFGLLGNMLLSSIGLAAGIWSQRFDHIAAVTNFFVTPLTFLSGTFYSVTQLPVGWQTVAHYNPFFYMIDGFRYGFIGQADGDLTTGIIILVVANILIGSLAFWMLKTGYRIKS